ncbi:unnamed protein product [Ostreobium quekettii]|uniref:Ankyrin repeat protein n=1 Tax=Ostreobium quekettii TaxID=121088 RepID=A0A8S1JET7_9CHLO|nr:unnamed protein product [Ostreobium quekettii]
MQDGDTPLSEAIYNGHPSTVELLLKHGANTDIQNETGATPLLLIWQKMWHQKTDEQTAAKIVQIMSDYGAALEVPNENGMTPLMAAARDGHTAAAELLLSKGVSVTPTDEDGRTAAQYASAGGHHELAEKLGGAD